MTVGNSVREFWQNEAQRRLPPKTWVVERNRAITAAYSSMYKERSDVFKWCGMAAFASHRVGLALSPYYFVVKNNQIVGLRGGKDSDVFDDIFPDLQLLRETNNQVFEDIAWAHYAYASPDGGIKELEKGLSDISETHHLLLDGFNRLHRADALMREGRTRDGDELIWEGTLLLLQHEQFFTVQPNFSKLKSSFQVFLSWAASMDFNAKLYEFEFWKFTSFDVYMWTAGIWLLLLNASFPNICNLRQRWFWISTRVLPLFHKLDLRDRNSLLLRLSAMIRDAELSAGVAAIQPSQRIAIASQ